MRPTFCLLTMVAALLANNVAQSAVPKPPARPWATFPEFQFNSQEEARNRCIPLDDTLPVELKREDGTQWLRLPGNYRDTSHARCSWDIQVDADLAVAQGIRFMFYAADTSPVSNFAVYFHSGDGWYRSAFGLSHNGVWEEIVINKADTATEESPGGWGGIDMIRISAWRSRSDVDTEFGLAYLGPVGADSPILVLRADSVAPSPESKTIAQTAGRIARCLEELGIAAPLLSDLDVTRERLAGRKLVILPYNPRIPDDVGTALTEFVAGGGKLIAFYSMPDPLPDLLGMRRGGWQRPDGGRFQGIVKVDPGLPGQPEFVGQGSWNAQLAEPVQGTSRVVGYWRDAQGARTDFPAVVASDTGIHVSHVLLADDWSAKRRLVLAMVGNLVSGVWEKAAQSELNQIGHLGPHRSLEDVRRAIAEAAARPPVTRALNLAAALTEQANGAFDQGRFEAVLDLAQSAQSAVLRAWCLSRDAEAGEHRAFWCHSAFGLPGKTWDEAVKFLADNGFNAILPNMLWGGMAYYPSDVLPVYADIDEKGDQIRQCLDACKRHGVECHVWKVNWNMSSRADEDFVQKMVAAGRVQKGFDGTVQERWLCPSHPENQTLEIESMLEVVRNYPVDGVHFDYIRYPNNNFCFCEGCRQRFEKHLGRTLNQWPQDLREDEDVNAVWLEWRRSNITYVVKTVSEKARAIRETIKISAAVFRNWPSDRDHVGQDWKVWCDRGYLDFVCPMDYTDSNHTFRNFVRNQVDWAGDTPVYPGIGLSVWNDPADVVKLIEQIEITREFRTGGFTVFNFGSNVEEVLPYCALGTTAR